MIDSQPRPCSSLPRGDALALFQAEGRFLDLLPVAVAVCDASGILCRYNSQAAELWGRELPCGTPGEPFVEALPLLSPDGRPMNGDQGPLAEVLHTRMAQRNVEVGIQRPDGSHLALLVNSEPICDADGLLLGVVHIFQDISPRIEAWKVLGDQARQLRDQAQILELVHESVMVRDMDGTIRFWNQGAIDRYGWSSQEALGQRSHVLLQTRFPQPLPQIEAQLLAQGHWEGELVHSRRDGSEVIVDSRWALQRDEAGAPKVVLEINNDITRRRRAEEALRVSEEKFRLLVEGTRDYAIFMLDPQGHVSSWNPGAERIKGYTAEEVLGQHFSIFYPEEEVWADKPAHELEVAAAEGRFEDEGWRLRKDGSRFWASVVLTALRDEAGRLRGFSKITRDMTQRRQAEENARRLLQEQAARKAAERSEARFRRLAEANIIGICFSDNESRFTYANDAYLRMLGYSREDLAAGRLRWRDLTPPEEHPRDDLAVEELRRHGVCAPFEKHNIRKDGTRIPILVGAAFLDPWQQEVVSFIVDLSERKRLEQELRHQAEQLAEADRRKDEFLALLAHELRNPLGPIRNALHALRLGGQDAALQEWAGTVVDRQVRHLSRMVDDLLDVSRITRGKVRLQSERLDLAHLVSTTVHDQRGLLEEAGLSLDLEVPAHPVWVRGDATRLAQTLGNLLTNAAKFTDSGGRVVVRLQVGKDRAEVSVRDTGIGLEPEMLSRVFEAFTQVDRSLDRSRGGLGLGLALVKGLVELHGGEVCARSNGLGQGTEVSFWLPLDRVPAGDCEVVQNTAGPEKGLRILLIEDNADGAESLRMLLGLLGHQVQVATTGPAGVAAAREVPPDVILCDLGLPGLDGYGVAQALRQDAATAGVRLIAISGYGSQADRHRCLEVGFETLLAKPVELEELLSVLKERVPPE